MKPSKYIAYMLLGVIIFLCFYVSIEVVIAIKEDMPVSLFSYSVSYVPTNSMENEIMAGDYVLFKETTFGEVDVDDIIVYKSEKLNGQYIIHRVIEEHDGYFITQGDNNYIPDEEHITANMIVGKYVKVVNFVGVISENKPIIVIALFITVFVTLLSKFVVSYLNEHKKQLDKKALIEQMKKEILEEELSKIKDSKKWFVLCGK